MKTLEEIAGYVTSYASGTFYLDWPEEFENLSEEDKTKVRDMVFDEVGNCDECGWYWPFEELEECSDGEKRCWQCAERYEEEE